MNHAPQALFNRCAVILSGVIMLGSVLLARSAFPARRCFARAA